MRLPVMPRSTVRSWATGPPPMRITCRTPIASVRTRRARLSSGPTYQAMSSSRVPAILGDLAPRSRKRDSSRRSNCVPVMASISLKPPGRGFAGRDGEPPRAQLVVKQAPATDVSSTRCERERRCDARSLEVTAARGSVRDEAEDGCLGSSAAISSRSSRGSRRNARGSRGSHRCICDPARQVVRLSHGTDDHRLVAKHKLRATAKGGAVSLVQDCPVTRLGSATVE